MRGEESNIPDRTSTPQQISRLPTPIYSCVTDGTPHKLRQGQILTNLKQTLIDITTIGLDDWKFKEQSHPVAILLTQDCDLEQDYSARMSTEDQSIKKVPNILFCEVTTAEQLLSPPQLKGRDIQKRITQNKDERYHFLQKIEPADDTQGDGLPELGIDFKRHFTIPTDEIYKRLEIGETKIRCVLLSPYLEHLSCRFAYFLSRVALPQDHVSE